MSRSDRPLISRLASQGEEASRFTAIEATAAAACLVWLVGVIAYFFLASPVDGAGGGLIGRLALVILPLLAIAGTALALRRIRDLQDERMALQLALDSLRQSQGQTASARPTALRPPEPIPRAEPAAPALAGRRPAAAAAPVSAPPTEPATVQSDLALGAPPDDGRAPIAIDDFIRALNFPDGPDDLDGIRCLRLALADREAARLIRAAQDVLTLLSQDGIYMDDLTPDLAKPEIWRRFATGERGRSIAALGGIRDRSSIALTTGRMRSDTIFRDAAHHFLRQFDRSFQAFEKYADDRDVIELADSRTARAFMLLGRVTGVFD